jgi:hypothetical protein
MADRVVRRLVFARVGPARGILLELVHEHRRARHRLEGRPPHEIQAGRRLHDTHHVPRASGQSHELDRLVSGDAAAHA